MIKDKTKISSNSIGLIFNEDGTIEMFMDTDNFMTGAADAKIVNATYLMPFVIFNMFKDQNPDFMNLLLTHMDNYSGIQHKIAANPPSETIH